ncbi:unnamed protein product [Diatraea saccharalis]|uniref:Mitochondrial coenzyme A transporter SLC25A42 n=1 Tax=Diatraea saccharalis TaxID=40085 RepID=A0A9N9WFD3_9NEOP|nr:unnamed protein product [Diatraea saccharalis]
MAAVNESRVPLLHDDRAAHAHERAPPQREVGGGTAVVTSLVAGAAAGALAKTTIAPLDRAKINFQTSQTPYSWRAAAAFLSHSARAEGAAALWRGNSATMARIVPYAAVQFTAHEQWKRALGVDDPQQAQQHRVVHLVAGSLAGVTSQSLTYPLDMARARMAVTGRARYRTLRSVFARVWAEEGARALYRGYPATVLGVIPYAGVSFFTYDTLKQIYHDRWGGGRSALASACCGGAAGALAQTASYPLDIVRRRMQTAAPHCATVPATVRHVYRSEGWRGFFKGLSMNWVKGPIAVGISFATYDAIKTSLRDLAKALM